MLALLRHWWECEVGGVSGVSHPPAWGLAIYLSLTRTHTSTYLEVEGRGAPARVLRPPTPEELGPDVNELLVADKDAALLLLLLVLRRHAVWVAKGMVVVVGVSPPPSPPSWAPAPSLSPSCAGGGGLGEGGG